MPKKIQPAPKKMYFGFTADAAQFQYGTIDLGLAASIINRRFYRQGLNWAVANVRVILENNMNTDTTGTVSVKCAQDTWVTTNAWQKSYSVWKEMNDRVLDTMPSIQPKFHDFKVFLDGDHENEYTTSIAEGTPFGYQGTGSEVGTLCPLQDPTDVTSYITGGEWLVPQVVIGGYMSPPAGAPVLTDDRYLKIHGATNADCFGMIEGYQDSRATVTSPEPEVIDPAASWMNQVNSSGNTEQSNEIVDDLLDTNDGVPYDQDDYVGGPTTYPYPQTVGIQKFYQGGNPQTTGIIQQMNTGPFNAQCGLIRIQTDGMDDIPILIEVTLVPGDHRGYLAQPMQDV